MSPSAREPSRDAGFSLLEVMVAILILAVALCAAALLNSRLVSGGQQSKYMSLAATLAAEKLEDLNRWDVDDPQVCVPTGTATEGSLTSDVLQTTTCDAGTSASVNYYDDVSISLTNASGNCGGSTWGCFAETVSSVSGGNTVYTTTYHSPDGQINTTAPSATPPNSSTSHRRWIIEANSPVTGTRRVTVLVTLQDLSEQVPVTFQMSLVRP
jgi:prepilin-type N-terminal cleavage/methylation domain-containing protein